MASLGGQGWGDIHFRTISHFPSHSRNQKCERVPIMTRSFWSISLFYKLHHKHWRCCSHTSQFVLGGSQGQEWEHLIFVKVKEQAVWNKIALISSFGFTPVKYQQAQCEIMLFQETNSWWFKWPELRKSIVSKLCPLPVFVSFIGTQHAHLFTYFLCLLSGYNIIVEYLWQRLTV
jgi:hypothetical protein